MTSVLRRTGLAALMFSAVATAQAERPFQFDDLFGIDHVRTAAIAPNGEQVAFVTERWTPENYVGRSSVLWLVSAKGGEPRRAGDLSFERKQSDPVWSPDSKRLVYLADTGSGTRLRLVNVAGRPTVDTLTVCDADESIAAPTWSPDSAQVAVMCVRPTTRAEQVPKTIVASESDLYDGTPYKPGLERRLVLFDIATAAGREVAKNSAFLADPGTVMWHSPDTIWIVATGPGDYEGMIYNETLRAYRYDLKSSALTAMPGTWRPANAAIALPRSDDFIVLTGGSVPMHDWQQWWRPVPLVVSMAEKGGALQSLSEPRDLMLSYESQIGWAAAPDGDVKGVLYFTDFARGSYRVRGFYPARKHWVDVTPEHLTVESFSVTANGRTMAVVQGDASALPDVYLIDLARPAAKPIRLTHFGDKVRAVFDVPSIERLKWRSADDRFDIDGWLVKPHGYEKGKRYPLIVDVHGGPGVAFRNRFEQFLLQGAHQVPPALYAARGYMVLMVNPRGDPGYGRAHMEALLEGWEYPTRYDIFSGVDHVVKLGYADPERLGIGGASYGGWVTTFAVTQTDRFKAASANDPVIDNDLSAALAYRGTRSSNYWLHAGFAGAKAGDPNAKLVNPDPSRVKTPILLRFGLAEQKPFPSQFFISGLEYFTYLHARCRPVEMIMHPEEGHGVFDGATWREYVERDVRWFDYWIKGEGESPLKPWKCES